MPIARDKGSVPAPGPHGRPVPGHWPLNRRNHRLRQQSGQLAGRWATKAGLAGVRVHIPSGRRNGALTPGARYDGLTFQADQSFGALAARMEARGLIERVPGPGRAVRHRLTPKGAGIREAGGQIVDRVLAESFRPLTPHQRATFDQLLQQLLTEPASDDRTA